ncbi:ribbon-helix-helix domain-containing protein [Thermoanaerobacter thermohydrosulfuricus]
MRKKLNLDNIEKEKYATYLPKELLDKLRELSKETRVPQVRYLEEALEDLLKKYRKL